MELKNLISLSELLPLKNTMITQLLISVSIFSLLISLSSSTSMLHYQNLHYLSSNSFHLMTIATNKNCIFLIFNGILVFLAKTSVLVTPPSASELDDDMLQKRINVNDDLPVEETEAEALISDKHTTSDGSSLSTEEYENEHDEDEDTKQEERDQEFEHSNESAVAQVLIATEERDYDGREADQNNHELQNCCLFDGRDQEGSDGEEQVDEIEKLSNEELNQKFEDFIRRMKEEFRINQCQHQQLVLVK